jgi:hypothetical protein
VALSLKYERMYSKKNKIKQFNQNEETALFAGGFKGKCNNALRLIWTQVERLPR